MHQLVEGFILANAHPLEFLAQWLEADTSAFGDRRGATKLNKLAEAWVRPSRHKKLQATARAAVTANRHDLTTLKAIDNYASRAEKAARLAGGNPALAAWSLRAELAGLPSLAAIRKRMKIAAPPPEPKAVVRKGEELWEIHVRDRPEYIRNILDALTAGNGDTKGDGGSKSGDDLLTGLRNHFDPNNPGSQAAGFDRVIHTMVVIPIDKLDHIHAGSETIFTLTNGTTITGARLAQQHLADAGYVMLLHPVQGPVNLYRTQRGASWKQRLMARAENPRCAWPGCHRPADESQVHHIRAWQHGGETNQDNLTILCPYHNAVNDDDPTAPGRRGHVKRENGKITWAPPHH